MTTNTELELRPLEPHEVEIVSGGGATAAEPTWLCGVLNAAAIRDMDCNTPTPNGTAATPIYQQASFVLAWWDNLGRNFH